MLQSFSRRRLRHLAFSCLAFADRSPALLAVSNHSMRLIAVVAVSLTLGCAPRPAAVVLVPRLAPEVLAARLADADRLASRGCYLCLKEAAAAYAALLAETDDRTAVAKALENNLMLAMREIELRMPDSGARDAAEQLQDQAASDYTPYFAALDALRL